MRVCDSSDIYCATKRHRASACASPPRRPPALKHGVGHERRVQVDELARRAHDARRQRRRLELGELRQEARAVEARGAERRRRRRRGASRRTGARLQEARQRVEVLAQRRGPVAQHGVVGAHAPAAARRTSGRRCCGRRRRGQPRAPAAAAPREERVGDAGTGQRRALRALSGQQRLGVVGLTDTYGHATQGSGARRSARAPRRSSAGRRRLDDENSRAANDKLPRRPRVDAQRAEAVVVRERFGRARALARPQQLVQRPPRARRAAGSPPSTDGPAASTAARPSMPDGGNSSTTQRWRAPAAPTPRAANSSAPTNLVRGQRHACERARTVAAVGHDCCNMARSSRRRSRLGDDHAADVGVEIDEGGGGAGGGEPHAPQYTRWPTRISAGVEAAAAHTFADANFASALSAQLRRTTANGRLLRPSIA